MFDQKYYKNKLSFKPDKITIDNVNFTLKSMVIYETYENTGHQSDSDRDSGHYSCCVKTKNGWIQISDSSCYYFQEFEDRQLKNAQILFYQKTV
jgi:hypothetical protein